jgi:hypothetical protein
MINEQPVQQIHSFDRDAMPRPCNNFTVGYDPTFFMLGFCFAIYNPAQPGQPPSMLLHRLGDYVMSPQQALIVSKALHAKIEEYEAQFGRIETPKATGLLVPNRSILGAS